MYLRAYLVRFCLILLSLLFSSLISAKDQDVLIIHSYHQGFFWTDSFQQGLDDVLQHTTLSSRTDYLDIKRLQSDAHLDQLYRLYQTKLEKEQFVAIIVSDNAALTLMQRLAPELGDTPVIFGGINNYSPAMHLGLNATGVTEDVDLRRQISLIERLQPQVGKIYVVSDHSITGDAVRQQVTTFLTRYPDYQNRVEQLVPATYAELLTFVQGLDTRSGVLFWMYYRDSQGWSTRKKDWQELNQITGAPIYTMQDLDMQFGAVGGVIQSGRLQGRQAANLLLNVLNNPLNNTFPEVQAGKPEVKLDYQAALRWKLRIDGESPSVFSNKPQTFIERYKTEFGILASVFVILFIVIIMLVYYLSRLKRSEQQALDNQTLIEMVFEQSYHYIGIIDAQGCLTSSNNKLQDLLYHQNMLAEKPIWLNRHWEQGSADRLQQYFAEQNNAICQFEAEIWHPDQGSMVVELSLKHLPNSAHLGRQVLLEARDITSRKLTEERLFEREASLSHYYEQQPVMMITLDDQNRVQQVNRFAEQLLGYKENQILGHRLKSFYVDDTASTPRQVLLQPKQVMKGVWRREIEYRHQNGHSVWVRENIRPLVESGHLLIVGEDVTAMRQLADQLAYQAQHDLLTDTYNRNYFEIELDKALKEVESHTRTHAMLYLDMDQLKVLNDTAGHEAGDAAIQFCASMLEELLPYKSILARMGGDEFAVLLKDCTERDAKNVASLIIATLAEQAFIWYDIKLNLACSIGIRLIDHTATSPQMVHAQADTACYAAKEEGRNRFSLYCRDDQDLRRREMEMACVNMVHNALANDRVELFAQRILGLDQEDERMHFEILVRIRNSEGEYISPGIFMPASERYNVAHLIDRRVVRQTLQWLACHPQVLDNLSMCAINLSGHSMGNKEFVDFLINELKESAVPCDKICLEITETAAMSNMTQAIDLFTQLKQLGCLIALDDFGSGLSSFGYLKKLPVDIVKIDGLFVRDMDSNEMDHLMVRSINDLAKQMGKRTVAEFVENAQIIDHLIDLGVDYAQGYAIGKPKPLAELVKELMDESKTLATQERSRH